MRLLVGLGNPGREHAHNRHNIGFMAADRIAAKYAFGPWKARFQGHICEGLMDGEKVHLLKPATYMNLSGQAVGEAARFYKIATPEVIVLYDEIELSPGKLRAKQGGGNAGHNGLKSIDAHIGLDYWRVRLGVGRPSEKHQVRDYVLMDFAKADQAWLDPFLDAVTNALPHIIAGDESKFMSRVALLTKDTTPKPPQKEIAKEETDDQKDQD